MGWQHSLVNFLQSAHFFFFLLLQFYFRQMAKLGFLKPTVCQMKTEEQRAFLFYRGHHSATQLGQVLLFTSNFTFYHRYRLADRVLTHKTRVVMHDSFISEFRLHSTETSKSYPIRDGSLFKIEQNTLVPRHHKTVTAEWVILLNTTKAHGDIYLHRSRMYPGHTRARAHTVHLNFISFP